MNEYKTLWRTLRERRDEVTKAIAFYDQSPDGQYDEIAAMALRAVLEQMKRDDTAK